MTSQLSPALASMLEMNAVGNGFDRELPPEDGWLSFGSTHCGLRIWLPGGEGSTVVVAFSRANVLEELGHTAIPFEGACPPGAAGALAVADTHALYPVLRRAFQLGRSLPDELLESFRIGTAGLPRSTEAERLVVQRVGQDVFRQGLLEYWKGRCPITGLSVAELLRASHIKPWAACDDDAERLNVYNGLLLAPHLDAAFDKGFMTVDDDGRVIVSEALDASARCVLSLDNPGRVDGLAQGHRRFLGWHRARVFRPT